MAGSGRVNTVTEKSSSSSRRMPTVGMDTYRNERRLLTVPEAAQAAQESRRLIRPHLRARVGENGVTEG